MAKEHLLAPARRKTALHTPFTTLHHHVSGRGNTLVAPPADGIYTMGVR